MQSPLSPSEYAGELRHRLVFILEDLKQADKAMIQKALGLAEEIHAGQHRDLTKDFPSKGALYVVHPIRVALIILEELELKDPVAISSALLHDVIEAKRNKISVGDIEKYFGRSVAMMVSILTKPEIDEADEDDTIKLKQNMYLKRIEQASVVTRLVKLSDRLDTVREASRWLNEDRMVTYLQETKEFYLPMAENSDSYLHDELLQAIEDLETRIAEGS